MVPRRLLVLAALIGLVPSTHADVKPHPLFTDHVVLQRDADVPVWGTADPGEKVTVTLLGGATAPPPASGTADKDGNWKVTLPKLPPGTGHTLTLQGKNEVVLKDVAVGDVWLCSGQSNMEWKLNQLTRNDQGKQVAAGAANPNLRLFTVPNRPLLAPQATFPANPKTKEGMWLECTPETVIGFSAVGYFFGRDVQKAQNVPVGLIASDWGGTPAEAWTSKEGLAAEPELKHYLDRLAQVTADPAKVQTDNEAALERYKKAAAKAKDEGKDPPRPPAKTVGGVNQNTPTALYNGMIAPLLPFPIKGAIWYQGESNAGRAAEYRTLFPAMIKDWRAKWETDFPFLCVQLAPFLSGDSESEVWAELREAQDLAAKTLPKVGVAVITDAGDLFDIHPQDKLVVGQRLARIARATVYGETLPHRGPVFKEMTIDGSKAVLTFDAGGAELVVRTGPAGYSPAGPVNGFTVCGEDKYFYPARAVLTKDGKVTVTSERVEKPVAVRFGWKNFPVTNLYNKAGLPAGPFRTDDFPLVTAKKDDKK